MSENNSLPALPGTVTKVLSNDDIQHLFQKVNNGRKWHIDVDSYRLIDEIIELWFETQGYDMWVNPYPDVLESSLSTDGQLEFTYQLPQGTPESPENDWVELEYIGEPYDVDGAFFFTKGMKSGLPREIWEGSKEEESKYWKEVEPHNS